MAEEPLWKHEQREVERKQSEEAQALEIAHIKRTKKLKYFIISVVVLAIIIGMLWSHHPDTIAMAFGR